MNKIPNIEAFSIVLTKNTKCKAIERRKQEIY